MRRPDGTITAHGLRPWETAEPLFAHALWTFLDSCVDVDLCFTGDPDFDDVMAYREIGGWVEDGDLPFDKYLADDPEEPVTYYAVPRPGRSREESSDVVHRRGPGAVDDVFSRNLLWEPVEHVHRGVLGDTDRVEITEAEAAAVALRIITAQQRPRMAVVDPHHRE